MNKFFEGIFVGIIFLTLFFSNPAFAYAADFSTNAYFEDVQSTPNLLDTPANTDAPTTLVATPTTSTTTPNTTQNTTPTSEKGFNCGVIALSGSEAKNIMDLTSSGFSGEKITDGSDANADGTDLTGLKLVGAASDGKTAVTQAPPTQASSASRFSFFDKRIISGPFGLGLIFEDTLRVGRCKDIGQENCKSYGNGLAYRTGGSTGFSSVFVDAGGTFSDFALKTASGLDEDEYTKMQNQVYDTNSFKVKMVQALPGDPITNSFVTDQFVAKNATSCSNNSCMVSSYSAFDKHFNAWFSSEMVVSTFGPTLLNSAAKKLGLGAFGPNQKEAGNKVVRSLNKKVEGVRQFFQDVPSTLWGTTRGNRYKKNAIEHGLGTVFNDLTVGKKAFSTGAQGYVDELLAKGSKLDSLTPTQKKAFYEGLQDLKAYTQISADQMKELRSVYDKSPKAINDLIQYSQGVGKQLVAWDDDVVLDFVQWVQRDSDITGLKNYAFHKAGFGPDDGFIDITTSTTFNFKKTLLSPFNEKGGWDSFARADNSLDYAATLGSKLSPITGKAGIQLYKLEPTKQIASGISVADLDGYLAKIGEGLYSVDIPGYGQSPLNAATINYIKSNPSLTGAVNIYSSKYTAAKEFYPEDMAKILSLDRINGRPKSALVNLGDLDQALRQRPDFVQRNSLNTLDALVANEKQIMTDYYTLKANTAGFYKAALGPMGFWQMKRAVGNENYSAYMLPDTWTSMTLSQGQDDIYKDAFVDFYANSGSDQGDLFGKVINSAVFFPNYIAKELVDSLSPQIGEKLKYWSGEGGLAGKSIMRDETKNIAFYSHNENCSGCSVKINANDQFLSFDFDTPTDIKSFIVEAVDAETAQKEGAALIAYAHHTDLSGKTGEIDGEEINISTARSEGLTCEQKLKDNALGFVIGNTGSVSGLILAGGESLAYVINPGFGMLISGAQQILITPELQDCIDDKEGYYLHFFSPPTEQQVTAKSKSTISNATVTSALSDLGDKVDSLTSKQENPVEKVVGEIKTEFDNFANKANNQDLLQASIQFLPPSSGHVQGNEVFYIWFSGTSTLMPNGLKTEGVSVTTDGNTKVTENYGTGDLLVDGKTIVDNKKEIVGLATQDNRIPAKIIPKTVTTISAPNTSEIVFEINTLGQVLIKESQVLECLRNAVKDQTGIEYNGTELTEVFGELKGINTEIYGGAFVRDGKIQLEGTGPRVYGALNAKFLIDGFWQSRLEQDANKTVAAGKFIGMSFENGSIVLNEETNELVVWLRQHKESILSSKEVSGMDAKLSTVTDPNSGCEQPAIELDAKGYPNDELGQKRVENFNTSMDHLGPFTQFTTDGKIYEFYSKKDGTGACKDYFRVLDKATGKVLTDSEIVGGISQDGDGVIKFKTADGATHTLAFDADNGVPKVSYNNGASETLRTAQGPNGSFWFDPNTGNWYPENGMQIPLSQAFKTDGAYYGADKTGQVSGTAGNPMTFNIGEQAGSGFNIPSLPETIAELFLFILAFALVAFFATQKIQLKKKKN
ncbi:MAG: hypothetical protein WC915_04415 [archaeon]|jgi:hypothetical protein